MSTETGWTREFPRPESAEGAVYWWRRNEPGKAAPVVGIAHIIRDEPLDGFDRESVEWLGPIFPSDFEQLAALGTVANDALRFMEWNAGPINNEYPKDLPSGYDIIAALREALGKGEK